MQGNLFRKIPKTIGNLSGKYYSLGRRKIPALPAFEVFPKLCLVHTVGNQTQARCLSYFYWFNNAYNIASSRIGRQDSLTDKGATILP